MSKFSSWLWSLSTFLVHCSLHEGTWRSFFSVFYISWCACVWPAASTTLSSVDLCLPDFLQPCVGIVNAFDFCAFTPFLVISFVSLWWFTFKAGQFILKLSLIISRKLLEVFLSYYIAITNIKFKVTSFVNVSDPSLSLAWQFSTSSWFDFSSFRLVIMIMLIFWYLSVTKNQINYLQLLFQSQWIMDYKWLLPCTEPVFDAAINDSLLNQIPAYEVCCVINKCSHLLLDIVHFAGYHVIFKL